MSPTATITAPRPLRAFDAAFDATPSPALIIEPDGQCLAINACARAAFLGAPVSEAVETLSVSLADPASDALATAARDACARITDLDLVLTRGAAPDGAPTRVRFRARARRAPLGGRRTGVALAVTGIETAAEAEAAVAAAPEDAAPTPPRRTVRLKAARAAAPDTRAAFADQLKRFDAAERLLLIGAGVGLWEESDLTTGAQIWSAEFRGLLGLEPPTADAADSRAALLDLVDARDRTKLANGFADAWTVGGLRAECRFAVDGAPRWFLITGRVAAGADAARRGLVGSIVDIDDRVRLEARLAEANAELERFAVVAAHDLQAPLRKIALQSDLLDRGLAQARADIDAGAAPDLSPIAAPISAMRTNAKRMRRSINDLLGRAKGGDDALQIMGLSLRALSADATDALSAVIEDCAAEIDVDGDDGFESDPALMSHMLQNLLSNALKYRSEAPPRVLVRGRRADGRFEISVADNGVGFEAGDATRIFEMSRRLSGTAARGGDGVGLAFCKRAAERLGGEIEACAAPGRGATFTVRLPDPSAHAAATRA